jgi:methionyl-tRNA formyltransferase
MRILSIVCDEVTFQPIVYEALIREKKADIIGLVLVPFSTKQMSGAKMLRFMFDFYGPVGFVVKTMQVICRKFFGRSLKGIARRYNIPVYYTKDINSKAFLELVERLKPDIIISSQGHFVGRKLRSIPRVGVINKHAGMLPRYRGIHPVFWAMLNSERQIGVTVHFMNDQIDGGDIVLQEILDITDKDSFESIYRRVVRLTPQLLVRAIDMLEAGDFKPIPNDASKATYFSYPSRDDIRRFKKAGKRIMNIGDICQ